VSRYRDHPVPVLDDDLRQQERHLAVIACPLSPVRPGAPVTWPPRAPELADWPVEWRERWGRLANELEESGMAWNHAESMAFDLTKGEKEGQS
jgi:hypothetical protein